MRLQLFKSGSLESEACALHIIVIPALGLSRAFDWKHPSDPPSSSWLQKLVEDIVPDTVAWEHVYSQDRPTSLASGIAAEADILLRTIFDLYARVNSEGTSNHRSSSSATEQAASCWKKALHICQQPFSEYRPVIELVSGAIFLGSPHLVGDKQQAKLVTDLLLRGQYNGDCTGSESDDTDVESVLEICKSFERLNLAVCLVSVVESEDTSGIGTLKASHETVVGSDADHLDICKVSVNSKAYQVVEKFFEEVMRDAPRRLAEARQPGEPLLEEKTRDPTLPCFSLGTRQRLNQCFGQQVTLMQMDDVLLPQEPSGLDLKETTDGPLRSFAICGLGGIGKTELVTEYAYSRKDKFDAVFWLGADDANLLASNFAQIAQKLGLEDDVSDSTAARDIVMAWLSRPLRKASEPDTPENSINWLLIFDNVDNLDVLSDYWPKFGRGAVLITSRDPFVKHNLGVGHSINLPKLTERETEAMMQRLTHVKADQANQNALSTIADALDGFPLAINQISGVFRQLGLSYVDFLKYYQEEADNASAIRSLATVWALDRLSPGTKALLQVICLLDPDEISEELLIDKTAAVKIPNYPTTRDEYYKAQSELISPSLINHWEQQDITPDSFHSTNKISLHRLIQDTAKARMTPDELVAAFHAAGALIIASWPFQNMKDHHSVARFTACKALFPSVLRLKNGLEPLVQGSDDFPLDISWARLFNHAGWYMFERGLMEKAKPFFNLGLLIGERLALRGGELKEAAVDSVRESHSFIGIVLAETNEHALSMACKKKWLAMLEERRSPEGGPVENYELGYAYNEIGVAYGNNGMLEEAADAFRRSMRIFQGLDDYEDTMLGWPQPNLGFIYWMQGELPEAEKVLMEILDIHATAWGVDDTKSFKTGKILYGIGNVLEAQGRFSKAFNFHGRCLWQFKQVLGAYHPRVGDISHRMAGHYIRQQL
ncbi:uncharacterized protein C8A04DRAFT_29133 [Dichotomopilus funicola]|uniref:DUF7779 domain-containing protein n=1 Tax=Dichotomopilus funicola TaxID=1934379 RepID=A0AAN6V1H6_9PEZI|nr:hypothetical protein C8A04DRAFT_29133 [Dichotomopilus funicola]